MCDEKEQNTDDVIIGIDLGTTYSLVSVFQEGIPIVLTNALGEKLTPSAVSVTDDGDILVGKAARARAITHPDYSAVNFKRDMGTERFSLLNGKKYTPQELSAFVLDALKKDAESALGKSVREAVVTVPAYFSDLQRKATRDAGRMAGLKVERIINEPTAAAMAYGLHELDREAKLVVLDLGGGTFDVTVLEIIEGCIEIQASAGDSRLGGEDFVEALQTLMLEHLKEMTGSARLDSHALARLRDACEAAKKRLSKREETLIALTELIVAGRRVDVERRVTKKEAESIWRPVLARIRRTIFRALRDVSMEPDEMDEVLLVGGATRMPCVARLVTQIFGRLPLRNLSADEAVAMGASVQAGLKRGDGTVEDMVVTDVAPFTLGIASGVSAGHRVVEGLFSPILERGTVIPASRMKRFTTVADCQTMIDVEVFQGEHSTCRKNRFLGNYVVGGIPSAPAGEQQIEIRFTYDLNGILEVESTVLATGKKEVLVLEETPGRLSEKEIKRCVEKMQSYKFHPRESLPNATALARAEALFVELTGSNRELISAAITEMKLTMECQDPGDIEKARTRLVALTESLRRDGY